MLLLSRVWGLFSLAAVSKLCLLLRPISAAPNNESFNYSDCANEKTFFPSAVAYLCFLFVFQCCEKMNCFKGEKRAMANSFKVRGCLFVRGVSKPLNARLSQEKMTVGKLILWNNLVGSVWTSTLSSSAYGWWFKRLGPLLTGEYKPESAFLIGRHYGLAPCFGLQFEFLVYRGCEGTLFWDKGADRLSSKSHRTEICLHTSFKAVSDGGWHYLLVPRRFTDHSRYLHLICSLKYAGSTKHLLGTTKELFISSNK